MTKVTGRHTRLIVIVSAIVAALAICACGGSSGKSGWTAAQKNKVKSELNTEFNVGNKAGVAVKDDVTAIKSCLEHQLFTKYSPDSHASQKASNKLLYDACGSVVKKFEHAMKAAEAKSEKNTITSSGSSSTGSKSSGSS